MNNEEIKLFEIEVKYNKSSTTDPDLPSFTVVGLEKIFNEYETDSVVMDGIKLIILNYIDRAIKNNKMISPSTTTTLKFHINAYLNECVHKGHVRVKKSV